MSLMNSDKVTLFILTVINFTNILDMIIIMPLGNELMASLLINPYDFSLLVSAYNLSAFFSGLLVSFFIDKYDRKLALLVIYLGFTLSTITCGFASSYSILLIARIFTGFFGGIIGALTLAMVSDLFSFKHRGKAIGTLITSFSVASVLGIPLGLYFTSVFSWRAPFLLVGFLGVILLFIIVFYIAPFKKHFNRYENTKKNFLDFN